MAVGNTPTSPEHLKFDDWDLKMARMREAADPKNRLNHETAMMGPSQHPAILAAAQPAKPAHGHSRIHRQAMAAKTGHHHQVTPQVAERNSDDLNGAEMADLKAGTFDPAHPGAHLPPSNRSEALNEAQLQTIAAGKVGPVAPTQATATAEQPGHASIQAQTLPPPAAAPVAVAATGTSLGQRIASTIGDGVDQTIALPSTVRKLVQNFVP